MAHHEFKPINQFQVDALNSTYRSQCFSGGYGNGKSTVACVKLYHLCAKFPGYRAAILRRSSTDLKRTTMATFFKWCPPELYEQDWGGKRVDSRNELHFINGSLIYWLHLDKGDSESVARGLEVNSVFIDQAEEIQEEDFDHMNARVGRWDMAEVPKGEEAFYQYTENGKPIIPSYMIIAVNPDSFDHWVYRRFHEDSPEYNAVRERRDPKDLTKKIFYKYSDNYKMYHGSSTENSALSTENLTNMLEKDDAFVNRFVIGKWGIPGGAIHQVHDESIIDDMPVELLDEFLMRGTLYRSMDHGYSDPTCVLWFSVYKNWILCYREYYKANEFISAHRKNIFELSNYAGYAEQYQASIADPDIFKKRSEKQGSMWSVADEYTNMSGPLKNVPPIHWKPGDNNEFMTRNMINELLKPKEEINHPLTGKPLAPTLYFLKKSENFPYGCEKAIAQLKAQKREQVAVINGEPIYSDERDENVLDHAYDPIRYFSATRPKTSEKVREITVPGSFDDFDRANRLKHSSRVTRRSVLPARFRRAR